jgi:hypothetical protein
MEDMKILWEKGVKMMDASLRKKFTLKDIIFVTIINYSGLFFTVGTDQREDRLCSLHRWYLLHLP